MALWRLSQVYSRKLHIIIYSTFIIWVIIRFRQTAGYAAHRGRPAQANDSRAERYNLFIDNTLI